MVALFTRPLMAGEGGTEKGSRNVFAGISMSFSGIRPNTKHFPVSTPIPGGDILRETFNYR